MTETGIEECLDALEGIEFSDVNIFAGGDQELRDLLSMVALGSGPRQERLRSSGLVNHINFKIRNLDATSIISMLHSVMGRTPGGALIVHNIDHAISIFGSDSHYFIHTLVSQAVTDKITLFIETSSIETARGLSQVARGCTNNIMLFAVGHSDYGLPWVKPISVPEIRGEKPDEREDRTDSRSGQEHDLISEVCRRALAGELSEMALAMLRAAMYRRRPTQKLTF